MPAASTRTLRDVLRWLAAGGVIGYVGWFVADNRDLLAGRFSGTLWHGSLLVAGVLATWIVNSLQTLIPLREIGARVGFWENLTLTAAVVFANYLPMRAGTVLRLHYVNALHGVGYLEYGGVLGVRTLLLFLAAGGVGLCSVAAMAAGGRPVGLGIVLGFAGILLAGIVPFVLPFSRLLPSRGTLGRVASQVEQAMGLIRRNRRLTVWYLVLVLLQFAILGGRLAVAFDAIQEHPSFWIYCLLGPAATLLSFVSITPGNLGLREWVVALVSAGTGMEYADGMFAPAIDRAVLMAVTLTAGGAAAIVIAGRLGRRNGTAQP